MQKEGCEDGSGLLILPTSKTPPALAAAVVLLEPIKVLEEGNERIFLKALQSETAGAEPKPKEI